MVTTSISGSTINLTTQSTTGSASVTICSTSMTACGIINVTIGNASYSAVSFSQSAPTVAVAQSLNVSIFGPSSSLFYVASNSNPSIVQANLSGSVLTLLGIANGSSVISVCASSSNCASLTVTVNSNSSNGGNLTLSQDNVNLSVGQIASVTISGGTMPYNILSNSGNIVQSSLNSNILTLSGLSAGIAPINVCSASGNCATLSVTVSTAGISLPTGCYSIVGFSPITGQSCGSVATTPPQISAPQVPVLPSDCLGTTEYSVSTGVICSNYVAPAAVSTPAPIVTETPASSTAQSAASGAAGAGNVSTGTFSFTTTLKLGSKGNAVSQLQKKLKALGFYAGKIDGGFGVATEKAVNAFQKAHKLPQVGSVGPKTRALLNK